MATVQWGQKTKKTLDLLQNIGYLTGIPTLVKFQMMQSVLFNNTRLLK